MKTVHRRDARVLAIIPLSRISVHIYGDYTYVAEEGFCEIPAEKRLPPAFLHERTISPEDEPYFVLYELDTLKPFIVSIQKELTKPQYLYAAHPQHEKI